jgi:hypothetical protein
MRIKSEALAKNQNLIAYDAVQKWDGKTPQIVSGDNAPLVPFTNIKLGQ